MNKLKKMMGTPKSDTYWNAGLIAAWLVFFIGCNMALADTRNDPGVVTVTVTTQAQTAQ